MNDRRSLIGVPQNDSFKMPHEWPYTRDLLERLYQDYDYKHYPISFAPFTYSSCYDRKDDGTEIVLGSYDLDRIITDGFEEYPPIAWVWHGMDLRGQRGVWAMALHEFAHVIQVEKKHLTGTRRFIHHGKRFAEIVLELQARYPYVERARAELAQPQQVHLPLAGAMG